MNKWKKKTWDGKDWAEFCLKYTGDDFTHPSETTIPKPANKFIKCPICEIDKLDMMHDQHGLYFKCPHCKWDSIGLYKTKDKYE